jgi:hypothetical protein
MKTVDKFINLCYKYSMKQKEKTMDRLISGGMKEGPFDGNITDIIRNDNNKLLFRLELCNITGLDESSAKIQISPMNFVNGDLVRAWGTVAISEQRQTIKFRAKHIERLKIIIKTV